MGIMGLIKQVMRAKGVPMTALEVHDAITAFIAASELDYSYEFEYVERYIQRHCLGVTVPRASRGDTTKHFEVVDGDKYSLLKRPVTVEMPSLAGIKSRHREYQQEAKNHILYDIRQIEPADFERFSRKLLEKYGFMDLVVTPPSKDGGVDGYGKLKVGLAPLNVAFQCKRWNKNTVGRPEIDKFRGAIQGRFELGIFFTTGSFASGAEEASFRAGAVPIILVDGPAIVDMMIEKNLGVQVEHLPVYSYALDLELSEGE
jgi:restriction system protein